MKKEQRKNSGDTQEEVKDYRETIIKMVGEIKSKTLLKRIYVLTEYLYLHNEDGK